MLRITRARTSAGETCLMLEGHLAGSWVAELKTAMATAADPPDRCRLDLAGVHFVDAQGVALLRALQSLGVDFFRVSPFVRGLMNARPK